MNYIDLFFILMIFLTVFSGYARGFVFSLISFVRFIIGVPLSFAVSNNYAGVVYDNYVKNYVVEKVGNQIEKVADLDMFVSKFKETINELPFGIANSADFSFLDSSSSTTLANGIVDNILEPVAVALVKVLLFVLTLWIFYVITWIIIKVIQMICSGKNVFLRKTNKFLGAVFGVLKALVAVFALAAILDFAKQLGTGSENEFVIKLISQLNSSAILEFVNKFNPILTM